MPLPQSIAGVVDVEHVGVDQQLDAPLANQPEKSLRVLGPLPAEAILSLDRRDSRQLDAAGWWSAPQHWPRRVIVMTLERVGADSGPDLDTLAAVQQAAPHVELIGAGGIRNEADLERAAAAGARAWLVASALHDGRIGGSMAEH